MKLIDRYVLKEFITFFVSILSLLVLIFYVAEFLRGEAEATAIKILIYNSFQLPMTLVQVTAPAAMLATMAALSMLNRRNELIAMQAGGIGITHITALIFGAILIICCINLVVNDRIVPPLARKRTAYLWREIKGRTDLSLDIKSSKIWLRNKNYIYNLRTFDRAKHSIQGFGIYFFDERFRLKEHIAAESAHFEGGEWILKNGMMAVFPEASAFPLNKHFDVKSIKLPVDPDDFGEIEHQVDTLRLKDLFAFIKRNRESGLNTKSYEVDFHSRLSISFIPIIMALLVIPYSIRPRRQGGLGKDVSFCIFWILFYWILFSISQSFGRSGAIEPWISVWTPSAFFLAISLLLMVRRVT